MSMSPTFFLFFSYLCVQQEDTCVCVCVHASKGLMPM